MLKGLYLLNTDAYDLVYGVPEREEIGGRVQIYAEQQTAESVKESADVLHDADVIFSGWGMAKMDEDFLAAAPNLKVVFYGAGSIKYFVTDASWDRGIRVTSAWAANAEPVVEYTLSQILFCLKRGWYFAREVRQQKGYPPREGVPGAYGSTVGIVSLGMIGSKVAHILQQFDLRVIAYDPFTSPEKAAALNVELCSLEDLFRQADVVSLHTPWLKETEGMITGDLISSMKENASLINTARGAIVQEDEMIDVLRERPDLQAVLDVTYPEPPEPDSPLYTLPNVALTPHIAGAMGEECRRLGQAMVAELKRYLKDEPMKWELTEDDVKTMA